MTFPGLRFCGPGRHDTHNNQPEDQHPMMTTSNTGPDAGTRRTEGAQPAGPAPGKEVGPAADPAEAVPLQPFWRKTITLRDDPEKVRVFPSLNEEEIRPLLLEMGRDGSEREFFGETIRQFSLQEVHRFQPKGKEVAP